MLLPLLLAALAPSLPGPSAWPPSTSQGPEVEEKKEEDLQKQQQSPLPPTLWPPRLHNASQPTAAPGIGDFAKGGSSRGPPTTKSATPATVTSLSRDPDPFLCNISVQRQMLSSLLVRWGPPLGFQAQCDLVLFSTGAGGSGGGSNRASFSAAFPRVGPPPLVIEPLGLAAGGFQQELRLCVGCSWSKAGARGSFGGNPHPHPAASAPHHHHQPPHNHHPWPQQQGERLHFCCLDFSLEELKGGDPASWRMMNRKPVESTLVACFMTLVIIVWSVAALIWPVPIIAGFLPNGMEQQRRAGGGANVAGVAGGSSAANPPPPTPGATAASKGQL